MNDRHDACHVEPIAPTARHLADGPSEIAYLAIDGMGCPTCATRVRNALLTSPGVVTAEVHLQTRQGTVVYDPTVTYPTRLEEAIAEAGRASRHAYRAETTGVRAIARQAAPERP